MKLVLACTLEYVAAFVASQSIPLSILWDFGIKKYHKVQLSLDAKSFPIYKQLVSLSFYLWNFAQKGEIKNDNFSKMNLFCGILNLSEDSN